MKLVPLNLPSADEWIRDVPIGERSNTILLLDALDEDRAAVENHRARLNSLLKLTDGYRTVAITCRTQFFPKDEEIPLETGILKVGSVDLNEGREHSLHKLYVSPFTDAQIDHYLAKRFPLRRYLQRRHARRIVDRMSDLVARPMLLAHVEDLVRSDKTLHYSFGTSAINCWRSNRNSRSCYDLGLNFG